MAAASIRSTVGYVAVSANGAAARDVVGVGYPFGLGVVGVGKFVALGAGGVAGSGLRVSCAPLRVGIGANSVGLFAFWLRSRGFRRTLPLRWFGC